MSFLGLLLILLFSLSHASTFIFNDLGYIFVIFCQLQFVHRHQININIHKILCTDFFWHLSFVNFYIEFSISRFFYIPWPCVTKVVCARDYMNSENFSYKVSNFFISDQHTLLKVGSRSFLSKSFWWIVNNVTYVCVSEKHIILNIFKVKKYSTKRIIQSIILSRKI